MTSVNGKTSIGLLLLRLTLGAVMVMHGWQKFNEWTVPGVTASFDGMGVPMAAIAAPFATYVELIGGVLIILGALTRPVAALNLVSMLGAIIFVHGPAGFYASEGGYEFVLLLAAASAAFIFTGAGSYSVDASLARRRSPRGVSA